MNGLRSSNECLVLLSPTSKSSEWVLIEIGMAMDRDLWIAPVLLHVERSDLPGPIRDLNPIDLNDFDTYLRQLAERARRESGKR